MRADRLPETKREWDKQVKEAPKDKTEALSYWLEKCAFWLYQIHCQQGIMMSRQDHRDRAERQKGTRKVPRDGRNTYYCIELFPSYPASIPLEDIRRNIPKDGEPYHLQSAMGIKEAKALVEARLNAARAKDPEAMPPQVYAGSEGDQDAKDF
jgi:hypothetical protein